MVIIVELLLHSEKDVGRARKWLDFHRDFGGWSVNVYELETGNNEAQRRIRIPSFTNEQILFEDERDVDSV